MKKLFYIILFISLSFYCYSQVNNIEIKDLTQSKPLNDKPIYNKTTNKLEISVELAKYYTDLEDSYKLLYNLIITQNTNLLNYEKLDSEKDKEILLLNEKITNINKLIDIKDIKIGKLEKDLYFFKTGFSVTLSLDFISLIAAGCFIGGIYLGSNF